MCNSCVVLVVVVFFFLRTRSQSSFRVAMEEIKFTRMWATSSSQSILSIRWRYTPARYVHRDFSVCFLNAPVCTYLVNNALIGACRFLLVPLHLAASHLASPPHRLACLHQTSPTVFPTQSSCCAWTEKIHDYFCFRISVFSLLST